MPCQTLFTFKLKASLQFLVDIFLYFSRSFIYKFHKLWKAFWVNPNRWLKFGKCEDLGYVDVMSMQFRAGGKILSQTFSRLLCWNLLTLAPGHSSGTCSFSQPAKIWTTANMSSRGEFYNNFYLTIFITALRSDFH